MPRLFVGIPASKAYMDRLDALVETTRAALKSTMRCTRPGNWHITLQFLGQVDADQIPAIQSALATVDQHCFTLQNGQPGCFPNCDKPRVVWVGIEEGAAACTALSEAVKDATAPLGFKRGNQPITPHFTLGRVRRPQSEDMTAVIKETQQPWPAMTVDHFVLWESDLTPNGPLYTPIQTFPLATENA